MSSEEDYWRELLDQKRELLSKRTLTLDGIIESKIVRELTRKKLKSKRSLQRYEGKEVLITGIELNGRSAIVHLKVDGEEDVAETSDKRVIERWLLDYKAALDLGAQAIKAKIVRSGRYGVSVV